MSDSSAELRVESDNLLQRIAAGDAAAERAFALLYGPRVRVLMRRHCRGFESQADDLVQDVLANVLERLRVGAIRDARAVAAYLHAAAVRAAAHARRKMRPADDLAQHPHVAAPDSPPLALYRQQLAQVLRDSLESLPVARDRRLLRQFYLDEHPKEQICAELNIEPAHFHRVMFRARERFRDLLERAGLASMLK